VPRGLKEEMKQYLTSLKNIGYIILLTGGLALLSFATLLLLFISIETIFFNDGNSASYNWDIIFSYIISIVLVSLLSRKQVKSHKNKGNINAIITWNISFTVFALISFLILGKMSFNEIKAYLNRDKNPKITTLMELVEHSNEWAGKTMNLSDSIFDSTLLTKDIKAVTDNVNLEWKKVHSDGGNFSVEFPNYEVKETVKTQIVDGGEVQIHLLALSTVDKLDANLGYAVSYFYEPSVKSIDKLFEEQKESILSKVNGTLETEYIIDSLGYPCRELHFIIDEKDIKATCRLLYRQNNCYNLTVLTRKGNLFNKGIYHFINSFQFQ
jgi:hypothetical protein